MQIYTSQKLAKFDYGKKQNLIIYGEENPPEYDLGIFKDYDIRTFLTRSDSDPFSALKDVDLWLNYADYERKKDLIQVLNLENYNHLDYLWSKDALGDVYLEIFKFLERN